MNRPAPIEAAKELVAEMFPEALQAWLAGSVTTGHATDTSDLDITVLLAEGEVHRQSLAYKGWPVELFVHTHGSVRHFVDKDLERRHPTMARLIATGLPLREGDEGLEVRAECERALANGPRPLTATEVEFARYALSDALDDLLCADSGPTGLATAVEVWRLAIEMHLANADWWTGNGKWLIRELAAVDERQESHLVTQLDTAFRAAAAGDMGLLAAAADEALAAAGGRLWAGFRQDANLPQPD